MALSLTKLYSLAKVAPKTALTATLYIRIPIATSTMVNTHLVTMDQSLTPHSQSILTPLLQPLQRQTQ